MAKKTFSPISEAQIKKASIATLADRPNSVSRYGDGGLSAQELKERFDAFPALVQKKINEIIDALASGEAAKYITLSEKSNVLPCDNLYDFIALFTKASSDNDTIADFIKALYIMDGEMRPNSCSLNEIFADITARFTAINADVSKVSSDIAAQSDRIATNEQKTQANAQNIASMQQAITQRDTQISNHEERITGIERYLGGDNFIVDDSTAYEKTVPKNACEKAKVLSIGGMTYKKKTDERNLMPYPYVGTGGLDYTVDKGAVTITGMDNDYVDFIISNGDGTVYPAGTYIFEVGEQSEHKVLSLSFNFSNYATVPGVTKRTNYKYLIASEGSFSITQFVAQIDGVETNITLYPMLYKSDTPITWQPRGIWLSHTKVKAIESKGANLAHSFSAAINVTIKGGVVTQISADTRADFTFKCQTYIDDVYQETAQKMIYVTGVHSLTFSKVGAENKLIFGGGGAAIDTTIAIDISDLPKGKYTVSANFTNITQGYVSWRDIMLNEGENAIPYTPYVGTIDTFTIPEEVQALEGYGEGINASYNSIEYTADGRVLFHKLVGKVDLGTLDWIKGNTTNDGLSTVMYCVIPTMKSSSEVKVSYPFNRRYDCLYWEDLTNGDMTTSSTHFVIATKDYTDAASVKAAMLGVMLYYELAEPIVTDITDLMPKENLIKVLGGCRIAAVNEQNDPVPFSLKYLVTYPKGGLKL